MEFDPPFLTPAAYLFYRQRVSHPLYCKEMIKECPGDLEEVFVIKFLIDILIILVLIFFIWRGAKRGLILSLFSLAAIFVAFFAAQFVATNFYKPVANIMQPSIQLKIDEAVDAAKSSISNRLEISSDEDTSSQSDYSLREVLNAIKDSGLYSGTYDFLDSAIDDKIVEVTTTASEAIASYLARLIATVLLFGLTFIIVLLLWFLIGRALDLAFKLPILSVINSIGGIALGLIKGILMILVLVWLARVFGIISDETAGPIASLMTTSRLSELLKTIVNR